MASSTSVHVADDFVRYFRKMVDTIRAAIASAPPPVIEDRKCTVLSAPDALTNAEIKQMGSEAPAKHCALDLAREACSADLGQHHCFNVQRVANRRGLS
jgi:hypothetical protein